MALCSFEDGELVKEGGKKLPKVGGTPGYFDPELFEKVHPDTTSDVYRCVLLIYS